MTATPFTAYRRTGQTSLPERPSADRNNNPANYRPSEGLVNAVNVAIALNQPLLVTGEPGTGKTDLAFHIAHCFGLGKPIEFSAQTTSSAKDLWYQYDALGHFQHVQTRGEALSDNDIENLYIRYQGLGQAVYEALQDGKPRVVLIDEIDKAPRDLPNDLLRALETLNFPVPEARRRYPADGQPLADGLRPIIIITSNSEKGLPDAFLRRVVYYHIEFPGTEALMEILAAKTEGYRSDDLRAIVKHFEYLRDKLKLRKKPATAELIYWARLLPKIGFPPHRLADLEDLTEPEQELLLASYSALAKTQDDHNTLRKLIKSDD